MEAAAATTLIKVAAICGSLRQGSFNRGLLHYALQLSKEKVSGMQIEYIDISPFPMLNTDLEAQDGSFPPVVEAFRHKIRQFDAALFASLEYNYSVTDKTPWLPEFESGLGKLSPSNNELNRIIMLPSFHRSIQPLLCKASSAYL